MSNDKKQYELTEARALALRLREACRRIFGRELSIECCEAIAREALEGR